MDRDLVVEAVARACGNRCGHDPALPRSFVPPRQHVQRPAILLELTQRARSYYDDPATVLPSLNLANGSERQQRSERREACLLLLDALVHYLDLVTMRVGVPLDRGGFKGLSLEYLAEVAGLGLRRAERACHDLVAAGIITVHRIVEQKASGEYTGIPAIRRVSQSLFKAFGLSLSLTRERDKASKRRRQQRSRREVEEPMGRIELMAGASQAQQGRPEPKRGAESGQATPSGSSSRESALGHIRGILGNLRKHGPP